jgi:hypothetical protein
MGKGREGGRGNGTEQRCVGGVEGIRGLHLPFPLPVSFSLLTPVDSRVLVGPGWAALAQRAACKHPWGTSETQVSLGGERGWGIWKPCKGGLDLR